MNLDIHYLNQLLTLLQPGYTAEVQKEEDGLVVTLFHKGFKVPLCLQQEASADRWAVCAIHHDAGGRETTPSVDFDTLDCHLYFEKACRRLVREVLNYGIDCLSDAKAGR